MDSGEAQRLGGAELAPGVALLVDELEAIERVFADSIDRYRAGELVSVADVRVASGHALGRLTAALEQFRRARWVERDDGRKVG